MVNTMTTVKISVSCICQDSSNNINEICSSLIKILKNGSKKKVYAHIYIYLCMYSLPEILTELCRMSPESY